MGWRLKKDYNKPENWYFYKITDHGKDKKNKNEIGRAHV